MPKLLELFSGTQSMSKVFRDNGWETYTIDFNPIFTDTDWQMDISKITAQDILERFGKPDVIWGSPDCTSYSIAGITHHRRKDADGNLTPISDYAKFCDYTNQHVIDLIKELDPKYFFLENPRGGFRKMDFIKGIPMYTVTYCQYGDTRMKPTDIFTNHPNPQFKPACKNGMPCHVAAPRGSATGTQGIRGSVDRSRIPQQLCEHIFKLADEGMKLKCQSHLQKN